MGSFPGYVLTPGGQSDVHEILTDPGRDLNALAAAGYVQHGDWVPRWGTNQYQVMNGVYLLMFAESVRQGHHDHIDNVNVPAKTM